MSDKLTHLDDSGRAHMVDVGAKNITSREAGATATMRLSANAMSALVQGTAPKGSVLHTARIAGIMAAKRVPDLIPLCHTVALSGVDIRFRLHDDTLAVLALARSADRTGVEMEALTAVSVAALTVYDMLKAIDKAIRIENQHLVWKCGGKSGDFGTRPDLDDWPL